MPQLARASRDWNRLQALLLIFLSTAVLKTVVNLYNNKKNFTVNLPPTGDVLLALPK